MAINKIKQMDWTGYGINLPKSQIIRVIDWNIERGLHLKFDLSVEKKLLHEEIGELTYATINEDVHEQVDAINDIQVVFIGTVLKWLLDDLPKTPDIRREVEDFIKEVGELVQLADQEVTELGFEPRCAFNETLLEIDSRVGSVDEKTGKWEKDKSKEAQAKWYKANYDLCRLASQVTVEGDNNELIITGSENNVTI